jgi:hypothetical protein
MTDTAQHTQGIADWVATRDGRRLFAMVLPDPRSVTDTTSSPNTPATTSPSPSRT